MRAGIAAGPGWISGVRAALSLGWAGLGWGCVACVCLGIFGIGSASCACEFPVSWFCVSVCLAVWTSPLRTYFRYSAATPHRTALHCTPPSICSALLYFQYSTCFYSFLLHTATLHCTRCNSVLSPLLIHPYLHCNWWKAPPWLMAIYSERARRYTPPYYDQQQHYEDVKSMNPDIRSEQWPPPNTRGPMHWMMRGCPRHRHRSSRATTTRCLTLLRRSLRPLHLHNCTRLRSRHRATADTTAATSRTTTYATRRNGAPRAPSRRFAPATQAPCRCPAMAGRDRTPAPAQATQATAHRLLHRRRHRSPSSPTSSITAAAALAQRAPPRPSRAGRPCGRQRATRDAMCSRPVRRRR